MNALARLKIFFSISRALLAKGPTKDLPPPAGDQGRVSRAYPRYLNQIDAKLYDVWKHLLCCL